VTGAQDRNLGDGKPRSYLDIKSRGDRVPLNSSRQKSKQQYRGERPFGPRSYPGGIQPQRRDDALTIAPTGLSSTKHPRLQLFWWPSGVWPNI